MRYLIFLIVVILGAGSGYYWFTTVVAQDVSTPAPNRDTEVGLDPAASTETVAVDSLVQSYRHDDWGVQFDYPQSWQTYENTFRAGSSLFNVVIQPRNSEKQLPRPIFVNITPADWGQTLYERNTTEKDYSEIEVAGKTAIVYESIDMSLPTKVHLFKTESGFWITIISKAGYEAVLDQILSSFEITPVSLPESN